MDNYPDGTWSGDPRAPWNEPEEAEIIDPEHDAEAIKNLAVAQALYKVVKERVGTGDPYNLRGEVDAIMRERFEQARKLGIAPKSFDIEIDGEKVGTYSITTSKPKPAETRMELQVGSKAELTKWAYERGFVSVDLKAVQAYFEDTGEVPDGCEIAPVTVPADKGGKITRTALKIDPVKVSCSLGAQLGDAAKFLLEND